MKSTTARWWQKKGDRKIACFLCPRRCVIAAGKSGVCNVRHNQDGRLLSLSYGYPVAMHVDPIEKKPLYHFYPGKPILSIGTVGCNLKCDFCQNWQLSRGIPGQSAREKYMPDDIIKAALRADSFGIAFTYNEPTIFGEYVLDISRKAHAQGLKTVTVTNGYITPEAIQDIYPHIDAANIDLKSFNDAFYRQYCQAELQPVLTAIERIAEIGTFIELTTLIIPRLNDSDREIKELCQWILTTLGPNVPLHFSAFRPDYKMQQVPPTPKSTLDRARQIALDAGLRYVYLGNVMADKEDNTYCHACGKLLIERRWFRVTATNLRDDRCSCGAEIPIVL